MSEAGVTEKRAAENSGDDVGSTRNGQLRLSEFTPYRFVALGRRMSEQLGGAYAGENLTIPEWRVLAVISEADAMAARDVVAKTPMDKMAVSRAVASLEAKGFVARKTDARDRRVYTLMLSPAGRRIYAQIAKLAISYERQLLSALDPAERQQLAKILTRLEAHIAKTSNVDADFNGDNI